MDSQGRTHPARAWRDRLAGRLPFDALAAEAAVRRVYRASGLPEPRQVLCAKGPKEAVQAVAFIENPPRRLRWVVLFMLFGGAAVLSGLALSGGGSAPDGRSLATTGIWSVVLAASGIAIGGTPRVPLPPGVPASSYNGGLILTGASFLLVLAGFLFGLLSFGLPIDPLGRGATLALAAALGTLPGTLLGLRMRWAYAHLPRSLRELLPSASVAHVLERTRWGGWVWFQRTALGPEPDQSLLEAHRIAYREAFVQWGTTSARFSRIADDIGRGLHSETVRAMPPHLEGIAEVGRAAAVACADTTDAAASFASLVYHIDRLYPFETIAVAVQPATSVMLDAAGRLHAEDGPALAWADGTGICAWHGRIVAADVLDPGRPIMRSRINREADPDRRWVLIERYGLGRYLLESRAAEIQRDDCGSLYRLAQRLSEPILAVRVVNHTPEPDGSYREFWLSVPPTMSTARQAVAWTFGLDVKEYDPMAQS